MNTFDQSLAGAYHVQQLRSEARRDAEARELVGSAGPRVHLRDLVRAARRAV